MVWWWQGPDCPLLLRLRRSLVLAAGALAGLAVAHAPWGWQMRSQTDNPFCQNLFGR
jgi:hypothetical protein